MSENVLDNISDKSQCQNYQKLAEYISEQHIVCYHIYICRSICQQCIYDKVISMSRCLVKDCSTFNSPTSELYTEAKVGSFINRNGGLTVQRTEMVVLALFDQCCWCQQKWWFNQRYNSVINYITDQNGYYNRYSKQPRVWVLHGSCYLTWWNSNTDVYLNNDPAMRT